MKNKLLTFLSCASILVSSGLSAAFVINPGLARAYSSPGSPKGFVNDYANIIDDSREQALESNLKSFSDPNAQFTFECPNQSIYNPDKIIVCACKYFTFI